MDMPIVRDVLEQHREHLLRIMEQCEQQRDQLQHQLDAQALQGASFETMRPLHDELTGVARDYWTAYGRVTLIDQMMEVLQGTRDRLTVGEAAVPAPTAARQLEPWARCAEETCPPFPPWV